MFDEYNYIHDFPDLFFISLQAKWRNVKVNQYPINPKLQLNLPTDFSITYSECFWNAVHTLFSTEIQFFHLLVDHIAGIV